jgi:hypothetical protein
MDKSEFLEATSDIELIEDEVESSSEHENINVDVTTSNVNLINFA